MRKTKGFAYDPENDKDIIDHIDNQPNRSQYIRELIRKDMKDNSIESIIQKCIERYLQNSKAAADLLQQSTNIDANDIQSILDL